MHPEFVEIGLACKHTYVCIRTAAAAPPVHVLELYSLTRAAPSFSAVILVRVWYLRFWDCPVVLDVELSVNAWYQKIRRVLLRATRLLLLLSTAESRERRLAMCGTMFKLASNGAETKY